MSSAASAAVNTDWKRLDGVDLLRGLAILFVLLNHVHMRLFLAHIHYTQGLPTQLVSSLVWNGQRGVRIFFAISGFLITSTSLRRWKSFSRVNVADFYKLRSARIAPLLLLLLGSLSLLHFAGLSHFVVSQTTGGLGRALLAALTFHINVLEAHRGYLPANWDILWSLSVEEMFYLFFPLIASWLGRGKWIILALVAFVMLGPLSRSVWNGGNEVWQEYSYLGGMDAIALGCLTAWIVSRVTFSLKKLRLMGRIGAATVFVCLAFTRQIGRWRLEDAGLDMFILAIGTCLIIVAATQTQWRSPRLLRLLLALGQRSYEVYLTHMFVVFIFFDLFTWMGRPMLAIPVLFVTVIGVSGLLGNGVAELYSEPMNRLLRRRLVEGDQLRPVSIVAGSD